MDKIVRNTFEGGLNTDLALSKVPSNQYIQASNLTLSGEGQFTALQNINGTSDLSSIVSAAGPTTILGVYANHYTISNVPNLPCLTIFVYNTNTNIFNILCYDITNTIVYNLFQETESTTYYTADTVIDAILYAESGLDILYFTDNSNEIRKLRCEIPTGYTPNFLTNFDISLQRRGALGSISYGSVLTGGNLLCGAYQFAYQMVSPATNKYSRWSLLSQPIKIFNNEGTSTTIALGGVGMSSSNKIRLNINTTADELAQYTHFRVGIIEDIYTTLEESQLTAYATPLQVVSTYTDGVKLANWEYSVNASRVTGIVKIPTSDLTVDLLAYQTVKTLTVKYNKLLAGNIKYKNLTYNNGTPSITGGSILQTTDGGGAANPFSLQSFATQFPGYFRDEVYRFAISYFDEFGNYSSPIRINCSVITDNQTANGDMKFPSRSLKLGANRYTLFNSAGQIKSLGLSLTGIDHHPTWAKGFIILRAKRYKNIIWQSPFVPMMQVKGMGAAGAYPGTTSEGNPQAAVAHNDAQPMGPNTTWFPTNFFWPYPSRQIDINSTTSGAGANTLISGEAFLGTALGTGSTAERPPFWMVFPQQTIYNTNNQYTFVASDKLQTVDAAKVSLYTKELYTTSFNTGRISTTAVSGTFYALADNKYYYDSGHSGAKGALRLYPFRMTAYQDFSNFGSGGSINGVDIMKYDNIQTRNLTWSKSPNIMKCGVVAPSHYAPGDSADGNGVTTLMDSEATSPGIIPFAAATAFAVASDPKNDTFVYTDGATHAQDLNIIEIVNCIKGLSDDRYGAATAQLEYIFTGTLVSFTNSEITSNIISGVSLPKSVNVFGGDCIVSPHTFKLTDGIVTTTNQAKYYAAPAGDSVANSIFRWNNRTYNQSGGGDPVINVPIVPGGVAQFLQIVLESEHNGAVMDQSPLVNIATANNISVNGVKNINSIYVPLAYNYNINYSKENLDKVFVPRDVNIPTILASPARLIFTDTKIYQSNVPGFDTFRILNFYDLDETFGGITKLVQAGDRVYSLQDRAIIYLPIGTKVIEVGESANLAINSGDYINQPVYVSVKRGCQNRGAVVETGSTIYFPDVLNRSIYSLDQSGIKIISDINVATTFRQLFNNSLEPGILENSLRGFYDAYKGEYWIYNNAWTAEASPFCFIFNEKFNCWIGQYDIAGTNLYGAASINENIYILGRDFRAGAPYNRNIWAYNMYAGTQNVMGYPRYPTFSFVVNPEVEAGKTFDDLVINATDRLASITGVINQEIISFVQVALQTSAMSLDLNLREGTYKIKVLRDITTGARMRGKYIVFTVQFIPNPSEWKQVALSSILTKYRISQRQP